MQSEKKGDKEMKLYKMYVMTYYEIEEVDFSFSNCAGRFIGIFSR